jgi:hypothetical protein
MCVFGLLYIGSLTVMRSEVYESRFDRYRYAVVPLLAYVVLFKREDVEGLPPTVISVNECDPWFRAGHADYLALRRSLLRTQGLGVGVQRHLCC